MRLKRKIFVGLVICMVVVIFLAIYVHYFQPEVQTLVEHNIKKVTLEHRYTSKHVPASKYPLPSPVSNVATLVALKINVKLKELNFTSYKKNNEYQTVLDNLVQDLKKRIVLDRSPWKIASDWVTIREVHPETSEAFGTVLETMAKGNITSADVGFKGTQLKMTLMLEGGQKVIFKPKRFPRDHIIQGSPYSGADRHNGEIAAFQLNRLLGFRRTPLTIGRLINLKKEIKSVATPALLKTFMSQNNNTCFYGRCYYCNSNDPACGEGDMMEGALILWLPEKFVLKRYRHPWQRTYRDNVSARWETDHSYCERVRQNSVYNNHIRLFDLIDSSVFDYLIGNADRHHYEVISGKADAMVLLLDNGKSFGNPYWDELTILAPLYQCCRIRESTYERLKMFVNHLATAMRELLLQDPLYPVLTDHHLEAFDRRLRTIIAAIEVCIEERGRSNVIFNNG